MQQLICLSVQLSRNITLSNCSVLLSLLADESSQGLLQPARTLDLLGEAIAISSCNSATLTDYLHWQNKIVHKQ